MSVVYGTDGLYNQCMVQTLTSISWIEIKIAKFSNSVTSSFKSLPVATLLFEIFKLFIGHQYFNNLTQDFD